MTTLNKKENRLLEQYLLLQQLKQRLEDSWSGASQVIEELEDFKYTHEEAVKLERNIFDKLQEAIDKFVNTFNLKDEV